LFDSRSFQGAAKFIAAREFRLVGAGLGKFPRFRT